MEEIHGSWRQAGTTPEDAVGGVLRIDENRIELTLHERLLIDQSRTIVVLGESMEHGLFTLLDVSVIEKRATSHHGSGVKSLIANRVLCGRAAEDPGTLIVDRLQFEIENLPALRNVSGLTRDIESGRDQYTVQWEKIPSLTCTTPEGTVDLVLTLREHALPKYGAGTYSIGEVGYFDIHLARPLPLIEALERWFRPLVDFASFVAGSACAATSVHCTSSGFGDEDDLPQWLEVRSNWVNQNDNEPIDFFEARFSLPDNDERFDDVLSRWLDIHQRLGRSLFGFLVNDWGRTAFMETRFITAAVALEGYHRRSHGGKVGFRSRIGACCGVAAPVIGDWVNERFVDKIVKVRNGLIHDSELKDRDIPVRHLRDLADTLHLVMATCLCEELGIGPSDLHYRKTTQVADWLSTRVNGLLDSEAPDVAT